MAKLYPIGIQNFEKIRREGYLYIDKTALVCRLVKTGSYYFLSRPRRFGKSLLISTLEAYFQGKKDLFRGLAMEELEKDWIKYPILHLDLNTEKYDTPESLDRILNDTLAKWEMVYGTAPSETSIPLRFKGIVQRACEQSGQRVVILIDEYDNFTNQLLTAYNDPLYEEVTTNDSFLRTFFKVIKKGIGEGSIRTCFCTGVLPVTMDDLTSGYNIAEILTLEPNFLNMLGFTYEETETYLRYVLDKYSTGQDRFDEIWQLIVSNYDGYRFRPGAEPLFNSTILTYFFKNFAALNGFIPSELVDENLRTDISWIRRLTLSMENAKEMLDALVINDELSYNIADLSSKFNKKKFFDKNFYPVSLFYLGMTTLRNNYRMVLPNLTMRSIYMDYYNEMNHIEGNAQRYVPTYERFTEERRFEPLVQNYFEQYLGQFPAQVFDRINENFIRCSFFELCSRYLSSYYTFAIEQNNSAGRSDFEMTGIPGTDYYKDDRLVEFKYFKAKEAERMLALSDPRPEDVAQVLAYAKDTKEKFPYYHVRSYIVYICANKGWKCWEVTP